MKVVVEWEDTNLPYTTRGPKKAGTFKTNAIWAWIWAQLFTSRWPRSEVRIYWDSN